MLREATSAEKLNEITLIFPHRVFTVSPHLLTLLNIQVQALCSLLYEECEVKYPPFPSFPQHSLLFHSTLMTDRLYH